TTVNTIHQTGATRTDPSTPAGLNFFSCDPDHSAASIAVIPKDASGIAAGTPGAGAANGAIADKIAQLGAGRAVTGAGVAIGSPDAMWSAFVTKLGVATGVELNQATAANLSASSAVTLQLSNSSVDIDEENVNLLTFQHAYQGAARVMTAVDEMLDTLINRTGLVGR
ncbi:MAG: flagellar basal body rod C-terminal domain-containing protein, partial [Cryobacterium sp.]